MALHCNVSAPIHVLCGTDTRVGLAAGHCPGPVDRLDTGHWLGQGGQGDEKKRFSTSIFSRIYI